MPLSRPERWLTLVVFLLSSCALFIDRMDPPKDEVRRVTIEWRRVTPTECGDLRQGPLSLLYGCATNYGSICVIEVPENAPDWLIAHEFKHCFGYSHRK